jgi:PAS domain S-box-containing protein
LATGFALRNGIQKALGSRSFWAFLAIAYGVWALDQWLFVYYEFGLHIDVPANSIADMLVFLHLVPFMAAVATRPHRNIDDRKPYRTFLDFLLVLFFWSSFYLYVVFPYQSLFSNARTYALRFDTLYLLENLALVFTLGVASLRAQSPWKTIYLHLLGASTLYALSSAVANMAIDSGGYVNGKLYGLGLTASACWFVWIPLHARDLAGTETRPARSESGRDSGASAWAMLVVLIISIPFVWALLHGDEAAGIRTFQLGVAIAAIVGLASIAYIEEYLARSEMASQIGLANDRLRLALQSGKSVGWDWDLKTGRDSWFGDLQTMFGVSSDTFVGRPGDFYRYVHPEDRPLVANAVADARNNRKVYQAEFRVIRLDGTMRWVTATGQFYYGTNGDPQRMLGIAVDITERRNTDERLRLFRRLIDESTDAIAVVDPKTLRFLDVNGKYCRDLGYTVDELLSLKITDVDPNETLVLRVQKELLQSGFATFESLRRRKDGSTFPVEINLRLVQLDRTYSVSVTRDITERKRLEEAMRQKEEELTEAQRLAGVGSWRWDSRTDSVIWSAELCRLQGHDPNLPAPAYKDQAKLFTPESWDRLQLAVKQALETGTSYELDMELIGPGSTTKWAIARGEPVRDAHGQIIGLRGTVQDITERKRIGQALQESEEKLRLILDSTAESIYGFDLEGVCTFCNPACLRALGYERVDELLGRNMHSLVHYAHADGSLYPAEECRLREAILRGEGVHLADDVLWRANGTNFPAERWCYPQRRGLEIVGGVVAFVDITERKLVEAALANVSGKLIGAQEQERRRIARELHDDIGQRVALLAIELARLQHNPPDSSGLSGRVGQLQKQITEIATDIQSLSHELHSSRLEYLGIAAALGGFCQEFSEQQKVEIDFKTHDLPIPLSPELSLCLFRVLQEAVHNSAKHSGVRHFEVRLWGTPEEIHLTVSDSGAGFDINAVKAGRGLGLTSMEERVKLLKGTLSIESQLHRGTTIHARVPVGSEITPSQARG